MTTHIPPTSPSASSSNPPLDFSFQEITSCAEIINHEPNSSSGKLTKFKVNNTLSNINHNSNSNNGSNANLHEKQLIVADHQHTDTQIISVGLNDNNNNNSNNNNGSNITINQLSNNRVPPKYANIIINGVRLSYNELTSLDGFSLSMNSLIEAPLTHLHWLDLSHNKITKIHPELLELKNLTVLYLHGNEIIDLNEMKRLSVLTNLCKLTLHGNPGYQERHSGVKKVRAFLIHALRDTMLKSLDFITLTHQERQAASMWARQNNNNNNNNNNRKKKKHSNNNFSGNDQEYQQDSRSSIEAS